MVVFLLIVTAHIYDSIDAEKARDCAEYGRIRPDRPFGPLVTDFGV